MPSLITHTALMLLLLLPTACCDYKFNYSVFDNPHEDYPPLYPWWSTMLPTFCDAVPDRPPIDTRLVVSDVVCPDSKVVKLGFSGCIAHYSATRDTDSDTTPLIYMERGGECRRLTVYWPEREAYTTCPVEGWYIDTAYAPTKDYIGSSH